MRARLIVGLAGDPMREPGEIVTGAEAVRFCAAGLAVPLTEEAETADAPKAKRETATRRRRVK